MSNQQIATQQQSVKQFFAQDIIKNKVQEVLGQRSNQFITTVLQIASSNDLLSKSDPVSILNAAMVAATLDLPINQNLGFAYIIPFNQKQKDGSYKTVAQFQLGYKGFIQLAQRSGQFKTISATPIYDGQLIESNPLTGFKFDFTAKKSDIVIGYAAYFELLNGFQKTLYMTVDEMKAHGLKFSQTFKKGYGLWNDDFDSMAQKTVIKLLLSKFAPLSIEMQKAIVTDQAIVNDLKGDNVTYDDHEEVKVDKEQERIMLMLKECQTIEDVELLETSNPDIDASVFQARKEALSGK
jgi:recombination protein RecT